MTTESQLRSISTHQKRYLSVACFKDPLVPGTSRTRSWLWRELCNQLRPLATLRLSTRSVAHRVDMTICRTLCRTAVSSPDVLVGIKELHSTPLFTYRVCGVCIWRLGSDGCICADSLSPGMACSYHFRALYHHPKRRLNIYRDCIDNDHQVISVYGCIHVLECKVLRAFHTAVSVGHYIVHLQ